jgi:hypothetical protein
MTPESPPQYQYTVPKSSGKGCLFWAGIVLGVIFLCVVLAGIGGYCFVRSLVNEYTDTKPTEFKVTLLSDADTKALKQRLHEFDNALTNDLPIEPLVLTADEINSLIAKKNNDKIRVHFSLNENRLQAQMSIAGELFGFNLLRGRYLNGAGDFKVSMRDGKLFVGLRSLSVKGKPIPEKYMQDVRDQNFAESDMEEQTNNPELEDPFNRIKEIKIENGKLYVIPKKQKQPETTPKATPKLEAGK